jgi:branched-chain amino acid transport system substrate-binding protein
MKRAVFISLFFLTACGGGGEQPESDLPRGISADSILVGSHTDLSGGLAMWGEPVTNGMRMRFDEVNEAGGIHGRRIDLVVEDTQYQVPLAVKATNKLINVDEVFAFVGSMGTPHNNAVMQRMFDAGVPNLFPTTAAVSMYEPLHPMKFSYFISYRDQIRGAVKYMKKKYGVSNVCLQALATDYGAEVEIGFNQAVEEHDLEVTYVGHHKGSETDFTGTITSIKNSGCELLVLGPFIKDAILLYTAARDAGWDAPIVANMVPYTREVALASNGGMEGFYASAPFMLVDLENAGSEWVQDWVEKYIEEFGNEPVGQAQIGYVIADLTVRALEAAGPDVTIEAFLAGLENTMGYEDPFGGPSISLTPTKHVAGDYLVLSQVQNGKWVVIEPELEY